MASAREIRTAGEILGTPSELIDAQKNSKKPSRRAPIVLREYRPSEEAQIKAISALLRDAINTVPIGTGSPTAKAPENADERSLSENIRAGTSLP